MLFSNSMIDNAQGTRARILILAYSCHPEKSMEDRNGWHRALQAARDFDVVVMCSTLEDSDLLHEAVPETLKGRIRFVPIKLNKWNTYFLEKEYLFYLGYRKWLWQCSKTAEEMHASSPFQLCHLVSLCCYREPGYLWKLDCPSILGPLGGSSGFRLRYLGLVDFWGGLFEVARNTINFYQKRFSPRIKTAIQRSSVVLAANSSTRDHLQHYSKTSIPVCLETGIDFPIQDAKPVRLLDQPLQILWTGRLRSWKALPLLLHAISQLPRDVKVKLRVIGDGKCEGIWKRLSKKLNIEDQVEWIKRPHYRDSIRYYRDADVFAFTSLRDTSGTGLLEALAVGTPIIGLNHQGAADIITPECGIRISVGSPRQSIDEFRNAIVSLFRDSARLKQLSDGALLRAKEFQWCGYQEPMCGLYQSLSKGLSK